jgi:hypothetical protein
MNLEYGYRLEVIKPNGFVKETHNISSDELPENINDMCRLLTETEEEKEILLNKLRLFYQLDNIKSMTFSLKGD